MSHENTPSLIDPNSHGTSLCSQCRQTKSVNNFYKRTPTRRDPKCIDCRRKERKDRYKIKVQEKEESREPPKRIIEPKKSPVPSGGSRIHESNEIAHNGDFDDMEKVYGKLEANERYEIVQRFNELVSLLREGYGELVGCKVYVRKD